MGRAGGLGSTTSPINNTPAIDPVDLSEVIGVLKELLESQRSTASAIKSGFDQSTRAMRDMATRPGNDPGTRPPTDPNVRPPIDPSVRPPTDPRAFDTRGLFAGLQSMLSQFAGSINAARPKAAEDDYRIGQMSRRYLDNQSMSLTAYRQRISNLQLGTGMDMNEAIAFTNVAGRFGQGTRRGLSSSYDIANQTQFGAQMAFSLGADRGNYLNTLSQLGRVGAVGTAGKAGGFAQDQRQFAITIAETLASGKLFDRLDEVLQSVGGLATEMASRGGEVNAENIARALASANQTAKDSGSAKLQERAPELLAGISRITAGQAQSLDPMLMAAYTRVNPKSTPGFGARDIISLQKVMQGSDLEKQSSVFAEQFKMFGGDIKELAGGKSTDDLSARSAGALLRFSQKTGMTAEQAADSLRLAAGVSSQQGQERLRGLKASSQYQAFQQGASAGAVGLYTRIATGEKGDIDQALGQQIESLSKKPTDKAAQELSRKLEEQRNSLKNGMDTDTVRTNVLKTIEASKNSSLFGAENPLEAQKVQTQELNAAFHDLASNVNQINAALGTDRAKANAVKTLNGTAVTEDNASGFRQGLTGLAAQGLSLLPMAGALAIGGALKGRGWAAGQLGKTLLGGAVESVTGKKDDDASGGMMSDALEAVVDHAFQGNGGSGIFGKARTVIGNSRIGRGLANVGGKIAGSRIGQSATARMLGAGAKGLGKIALPIAAAMGAYEIGSDILSAGTNAYEGHNEKTDWGRMIAGGLGAGAGILGLGLSTGGVGFLGAGMAGAAGYGAGTMLYDTFFGGSKTDPATGQPVVGGGNPDAINKDIIDSTNIQELRVARMIVENQQIQQNGVDLTTVGGGNPGSAAATTSRNQLFDATTGKPLSATGSTSAPAGSGRSSGGSSRSGGAPSGGADLSQYEAEIQEAAKTAGIDPAYIRAIINKESGGQANAVGDNGQSFGLGQIQLATARGIDKSITAEDLLDPRKNILMMGKVLLNKKGGPNGKGSLYDQVRGYNGSGPAAEAYARDIFNTVQGAGQKPVGGGNPFGEGANIQTTSTFGQTSGYTNLTGNPWNRGADFAAVGKAPVDIFAPIAGKIIEVFDKAADTGEKSGQESQQQKVNQGWGNSVVIQGADGTKHRLSHLANVADLKVGQQIDAGTRLGRMGATGNTTGRHLDWEIEKNGLLFDANAWMRTGQLTGGRNRAGQVVGGGVGGGNPDGAAAGGDSRKVEISIKLSQDKNGNITGKVQNPEKLVINFDNKDPYRQTWSAPIDR